jgi:FixJ family two-component response regulator
MNAIDKPVVFLVDDDVQVLRAHGRLLREHGLETVAFESAEDFLAQHDRSRPGCLVLDVNLPGLNGLELQRRLVADGCVRTIVFLTGHANIPMTVEAVKAGATDFLTKPVPGDVLLSAVRVALANDARARRESSEDEMLRQRCASLSAREREVLEKLAAGRLNKQIAGELGIAEATVKFHRARLMERMQARTVAELMHAAARLQLISTPAPAAAPGEPELPAPSRA